MPRRPDRASGSTPMAEAGLRGRGWSWSLARLRPSPPKLHVGEETSRAMPAREFNADERAARARSAVIVFLVVATAAIAIPVFLVTIWLS